MTEKKGISKEEFSYLLRLAIRMWDSKYPRWPMKERLGKISFEELLDYMWSKLDIEEYSINLIDEYLNTDRYIDDLRWKK